MNSKTKPAFSDFALSLAFILRSTGLLFVRIIAGHRELEGRVHVLLNGFPRLLHVAGSQAQDDILMLGDGALAAALHIVAFKVLKLRTHSSMLPRSRYCAERRFARSRFRRCPRFSKTPAAFSCTPLPRAFRSGSASPAAASCSANSSLPVRSRRKSVPRCWNPAWSSRSAGFESAGRKRRESGPPMARPDKRYRRISRAPIACRAWSGNPARSRRWRRYSRIYTPARLPRLCSWLSFR